MNKTIRSDLFRYGGLKGFKGFRKGMKIPGFRYTYYLRMAKNNKKFTFKGAIARFFIIRLGYKYGYQIDFEAQIGKGFYIGHYGCVVVAPQAVLGENCNISHNVTIGGIYSGRKKGFPSIKDRVWIGTGAVIVGNIKIGSDVRISPNSFINFDVPDNSTVIGNPARIIRKDKPSEGYINYILD